MSVATQSNALVRVAERDRPPEPYRFTKSEYQKMTEAGLFLDKRVELVNGIVYFMPGQSYPHRLTVSRLMWILSPQIDRSNYWLMGQSTLELDEWSPEPDFATMIGKDVSPEADKQRSAWTIEVSDSSLRHDLTVKANLYAADAVPEYWVFDVRRRVVHVHRQPVDGHYLLIEEASVDQTLSPTFDPRIRVVLADAMPLTF